MTRALSTALALTIATTVASALVGCKAGGHDAPGIIQFSHLQVGEAA